MFEHDKDLTHLTTFGIPAECSVYAEFENVRQLTWISRQPEFLNNPVFHMGGGSNLLFTGKYEGLVLRSRIMGKTIYRNPDRGTVTIIAGAGEDWSEFVRWTIDNDLAGLENLIGIPGQVGASAVQNIGAYGVEAGDRIFSVECFDCERREVVRFDNKDCHFGYRDSRFKHEWKGRYYVLRVAFRLEDKTEATTLTYGPLKNLAERLGHTPTIREVADEVESIRNRKLPDPKEIGSAGSFFMNPIVLKSYYDEEILRRNPDVPAYIQEEKIQVGKDIVKVTFAKLNAGWLIEHAGLKGYSEGGAEVYPKQCLVIANLGWASAEAVMKVAKHVQNTVREKYGVWLKPEVNYISSHVEVTVLGSGTSKGVPEIACDCHVCRSTDPHDKRQRASILVKAGGKTLLIDASPDLRLQAVATDLHHVDAVLLTHEHYDHVGGIDDLRPFCGRHNMNIYARPDVCEALKRRLDYAFNPHPYPGVPTFNLHEIHNSPFYVDGVKVTPIEVLHGHKPIVGYRIGDFAYLTDVKTIDERELEKLEGVKVLILNALREREHFAHLNFEEARAIIDIVKPEHCYLTHFSHEAGTHEEIAARFPSNISPAYDGLHFKV